MSEGRKLFLAYVRDRRAGAVGGDREKGAEQGKRFLWKTVLADLKRPDISFRDEQ